MNQISEIVYDSIVRIKLHSDIESKHETKFPGDIKGSNTNPSFIKLISEISYVLNDLNSKIGHIFPYPPIVFSVLSENDSEVENQVELVSSLECLGSQFAEMQITNYISLMDLLIIIDQICSGLNIFPAELVKSNSDN